MKHIWQGWQGPTAPQLSQLLKQGNQGHGGGWKGPETGSRLKMWFIIDGGDNEEGAEHIFAWKVMSDVLLIIVFCRWKGNFYILLSPDRTDTLQNLLVSNVSKLTPHRTTELSKHELGKCRVPWWVSWDNSITRKPGTMPHYKSWKILESVIVQWYYGIFWIPWKQHIDGCKQNIRKESSNITGKVKQLLDTG